MFTDITIIFNMRECKPLFMTLPAVQLKPPEPNATISFVDAQLPR
jgi:hypothetical protein